MHDIGHRFGPDEQHGVLGAERVRALLGDRVAGLVEAHVPAKRYLVTTDASYRSRLSTESTRTLEGPGRCALTRRDRVLPVVAPRRRRGRAAPGRRRRQGAGPGGAGPGALGADAPGHGRTGGHTEVTPTLPVRRGVVGGPELEALQAWATEVEAWPAGSHRWGQYAERTRRGTPSAGPRTCRPATTASPASPAGRWRPWPRRSWASAWSTSRTRSTTSSPVEPASAPIRTWPPIPARHASCRSWSPSTSAPRPRGASGSPRGWTSSCPPTAGVWSSPTSCRRCRGHRPSSAPGTPVHRRV